MLPANEREILARLNDDALVLDVGGGFNPFQRADWVLDLTRYRDRGLYGPPIAPEGERFTEQTWMVRDVCAREPWPFSDKQFDFVVCSHMLEDIRDPVWVCDELIRVGKAGYIEVPSRLEEQSFGVNGPWVGWSHHRWLIDIEDNSIDFVFKHHVVHGRESDHFSAEFRASLGPQERVQWLFWDGSFRYRERMLMSAAEVDGYVGEIVTAYRDRAVPPSRQRRPSGFHLRGGRRSGR